MRRRPSSASIHPHRQERGRRNPGARARAGVLPMSAADRIASGAAPAARATSSRKDCGARMSSVDRSDCRPFVRPASKPDRNRGRVMRRSDDDPPRPALYAAGELSGVDLILECEPPRAGETRATAIQNDGAGGLAPLSLRGSTRAEPVGLGADRRTIGPYPQKPAGHEWTTLFLLRKRQQPLYRRILSSGMS
jgi:hypothetical protein